MFVIDELTRELATRSPGSETVFILDGAPAGYLPISSMKRRDGTAIQSGDKVPVTIAAGAIFVTATASYSSAAPASLTVDTAKIVRSSAAGGMPTFDSGASVQVKVVLTADSVLTVDDEGNPTRPDLFRTGAILRSADRFSGELGSNDGEAVAALGTTETDPETLLTARSARAGNLGGLFVQDDAETRPVDGIDTFASDSGRKVRVGLKVGTTTSVTIPTGGVVTAYDATQAGARMRVDIAAKDGSAWASSLIVTDAWPETGEPPVSTGYQTVQVGGLEWVTGETGTAAQIRNTRSADIEVAITLTRI